MLNKYFTVFIAYATAIWFMDFFYEMAHIQSSILSVVIAIGIILVTGKIIYSHRAAFYQDDFSVYDYFVLTLVVVVYFSHVHLPDTGWDVISYHLLHQEHLPWSQVRESFFPSTILHSFLYPLGVSFGVCSVQTNCKRIFWGAK